MGGNLFSYRSTKCVVGFFWGENLGEGGSGGGTYRRTVCPNAEMGWIGSFSPYVVSSPEKIQTEDKNQPFLAYTSQIGRRQTKTSLVFSLKKFTFSGILLLLQIIGEIVVVFDEIDEKGLAAASSSMMMGRIEEEEIGKIYLRKCKEKRDHQDTG